MKTFLIIAALVIAVPAAAQQTIYTGPYGQPQGSSQTYGNQTIYTGPYGQPMGTATTNGNTTTYTGPYGQPRGSSTTYGGTGTTIYSTRPRY